MNRILLSILLTSSLFAREYIAIIDFEGINVSDGDAKALTQRLTTEMIALEVYQILERSKMKRLLDEQKFQYSGCVDTQCAIEVGKLLGAKYMVVGTVTKVGETFAIDSRMLDVKTGESYMSAKYNYKGEIDKLLSVGMTSIAHQLSELEDSKILQTDDDTDNEDEDDEDDDKDESDSEGFDPDDISFYVQWISSETFNKYMTNLSRQAIGASLTLNYGFSISIAYYHLNDDDHDNGWFKTEHYFDAVGMQIGLKKTIIEEYLSSQISFGALNSRFDTDGEFDKNYIDKQLGYCVGLSLLGNPWGGESFMFNFNAVYDYNSIRNEYDELLLDGLSLGFGIQIN